MPVEAVAPHSACLVVARNGKRLHDAGQVVVEGRVAPAVFGDPGNQRIHRGDGAYEAALGTGSIHAQRGVGGSDPIDGPGQDPSQPVVVLEHRELDAGRTSVDRKDA
jgi:hypothetical protein